MLRRMAKRWATHHIPPKEYYSLAPLESHGNKINENSKRVLTAMGFDKMYPIQAELYKRILNGEDLLVTAGTGCGKTFGFILPMMEKLVQLEPPEVGSPNALVICSTYEVSKQVAKSIEDAANKKLSVACVVKGNDTAAQLIKEGEYVDVIVATPGKLQQSIEHGNINTENVKIVVVDDAEHVYSGETPEVINLFKLLKNTGISYQLVMLSMTAPRNIKDIARNLFRGTPEHMEFPWKQNPSVKHSAVVYPHIDKTPLAIHLLKKHWKESPHSKAIIFGNSLGTIEDIKKRKLLSELGTVEELTSFLSSSDRLKRIRRFCGNIEGSAEPPVLLATDLLSHGIHIPGLDVIINLGFPTTPQAYIKRAGRVGRSSALGTVITILSPGEEPFIKQYEETVRVAIEPLDIPQKDMSELLEKSRELVSTNAPGKRFSSFGARTANSRSKRRAEHYGG
eukprot:TRINITY_DN27786_c0_g1_i1.p1 TRINITY_DN27786_c0_g1~~TRINITY_DN27786_c0_g1_i1.p1  ORF type:complete len:469 (+),score=83.68 TRINITY_DN27786_c0_g1_i1:53-1408(+)